MTMRTAFYQKILMFRSRILNIYLQLRKKIELSFIIISCISDDAVMTLGIFFVHDTNDYLPTYIKYIGTFFYLDVICKIILCTYTFSSIAEFGSLSIIGAMLWIDLCAKICLSSSVVFWPLPTGKRTFYWRLPATCCVFLCNISKLNF